MRAALLVLASAWMAGSAAAQGPLVEGKAGSAVRVLIFEDLQCPDCAAFREMLDEKLLPKYGGRVAFEHRDFPLAKHAWARKASVASRYFQGLSTATAVKFRQETMRAQREIKAAGFEEWLKGWCASNGLDAEKAMAALGDEKLGALVEKDFQDGVARGIARTPTVLVNGEPFIETFTFEEIARGIETALKESGIQ